MAITQIKGSNIEDGTVVAADVADDAVTTAKILDANVTTAKVADTAITNAKIADLDATKLTGTIASARLGNVDLTTLSASNLTTGTVAEARLATLDATKLTGTIDGARFPATLPAISGASLTGLPTSLDATPDTDHTANGPQTNTVAAGYTSVLMDLVYLGTGGKWLEAQADATARSISLLGIALEVKNDTQAMNVALSGSFIADASWTWAVGVPLYISGTLGAITATKPTTSGHVVRTVGYSLSATTIFFAPSSDYVTLA